MSTANYSYKQLGDEIVTNGWGPSDLPETIRESLQSLTADRRIASLLASVIGEIRGLRADMNQMPARVTSALKSEETKLEREKQKTAKLQLKAIEATPPTVTVIQMFPEEIEFASNNGRVLRHF